MGVKVNESRAVVMMPDRRLKYPFLYRLSAER
jgi:hypothetical protein